MLTKTDADQIISPFKDRIYHVIQNGHKDYHDNYSGQSPIHSERTKTNIIRDHIVHRAKMEFPDNDKHQSFLLSNGLFLLIFKSVSGSVGLWFKKLDVNKMNSNIQTQQIKELQSQLSGAYKQLQLEGIPQPPTIILAGYRPDFLGTGIKAIYLACRYQKTIQWYEKLEITQVGTATTVKTSGAEITELPIFVKPNIQKAKDGTQG